MIFEKSRSIFEKRRAGPSSPTPQFTHVELVMFIMAAA
jgi:hypothetical protein